MSIARYEGVRPEAGLVDVDDRHAVGSSSRPKRDDLQGGPATLTSMHSRLVMSSSSIIRTRRWAAERRKMVDGFARRVSAVSPMVPSRAAAVAESDPCRTVVDGRRSGSRACVLDDLVGDESSSSGTGNQHAPKANP
jgi:hypothetical protein